MTWSCLACGSQFSEDFQFCGHCGAKRAGTAGGGGEVDDVLRALVGEQLRSELVEHGGRLPEERRLVTALFADLSGFTSLAGRLDPEALARVVDPILAALVRVVKRREGHVGAFAGDALLCYFGAPVAHEDDAARAVHCAHQMLAEFPALLAAAPPEAADLTLRIGIDTGAVMARLVAGDIKTDYNILGNAVNMAQRLQSSAPPGALVVGETTYRLTADDFEYVDIGPLQVKGRAEPLAAFQLVRPRDRAVLRRVARSDRVRGREAELAAIAAAEDGTRARGLAVVAEAGTGKSRLLQAARARSTRPWFEGGCAPQEKDRSYRSWAGALEAVVESVGPDELADGVRIVLRREVDLRLESLHPALRRDLVARDVVALLRAAAPCVVVLEDLHWADRPTLDLLDDVLFDGGDVDVLVVATSRDKVPATAELSLLELGPLEPDAVSGLLADLLGGAPPGDLVSEVVRRTGGNPLYIGELAFALRDRGLVSLADGGVLVTTAAGLAQALDLVPESVEGLIGARIDELPAAQERALTIAAALGASVDERLVAAVAAELAEPHGETADAVRGLRAAGMVVGPEFAHDLIMSTAYVRTPRARRRQLHLAAAAVGPGRVPDDELPGYLARHLYLAGAGARAVEALERAAEHALARGAHEEGLLHLDRELELRRADDAGPEHRAALPDRLVVAGELLELLGRYDEAQPIFREAVDLGAGPPAYRGVAGSLRRLGEYDQVIEVADEVLSSAVDAGMRARMSWEKAAALAALGRWEDALVALEAGPDPHAAARQDLVRGYCLMELHGPDQAIPVLERAVEVLADADDPQATSHGLRNLGWALARNGEPEAAVERLQSALRLARRHGLPEEVMSCLNNLAYVTQAVDPELAVQYAQESVVQSDRMRHSFGRAVTRNNLADALTAVGRPQEAVAVATQAIELSRSLALAGVEGSFLETRGRARLGAGDEDGARADALASWTLVEGTEEEDGTRDLLRLLGMPAPGDQ